MDASAASVENRQEMEDADNEFTHKWRSGHKTNW